LEPKDLARSKPVDDYNRINHSNRSPFMSFSRPSQPLPHRLTRHFERFSTLKIPVTRRPAFLLKTAFSADRKVFRATAASSRRHRRIETAALRIHEAAWATVRMRMRAIRVCRTSELQARGLRRFHFAKEL